jgi:membrane-bound serine protease (ClpP class)
VGLANWIEIAVFVLGLVLLMVEVFVIPGFGIAGIAGILCVVAGLFGMLLRNGVNEIPWPKNDLDWQTLQQGVYGLTLGLVGFVVLAALLTRYMPKISFLSGLILVPGALRDDQAESTSTTRDVTSQSIGDIGLVVTQLHPTGRVRFGDQLRDCVTLGDLVVPDTRVEIVNIHGNRIVVRPMA